MQNRLLLTEVEITSLITHTEDLPPAPGELPFLVIQWACISSLDPLVDAM